MVVRLKLLVALLVLGFIAFTNPACAKIPGVLGYAAPGIDPTPAYVAANPYGWASPQGFTFSVLNPGMLITALGAYRPSSYSVNFNQVGVQLYEFASDPATPLPSWGALEGTKSIAGRNGAHFFQQGAVVGGFNGSFMYAPLDSPVALAVGVRYAMVFFGYAVPRWDPNAQVPVTLSSEFAFGSPVTIQPNGTSAPFVSASGYVVGPAFQFSTVPEPAPLSLVGTGGLVVYLYAAARRRRSAL